MKFKNILLTWMMVFTADLLAGDQGLNFRIMPDSATTHDLVILEIEENACAGIEVIDVVIDGFNVAVNANYGNCPILPPPVTDWHPIPLGQLPAGEYQLNLTFAGQQYSLMFVVSGADAVAVSSSSFLALVLLMLLLLFLTNRIKKKVFKTI